MNIFTKNEEFSKFCYKRDEKLAGDEAIVADVVMQFSLDVARANDFFVVLEPTCFERKKAHLDFLFSGEFFFLGKVNVYIVCSCTSSQRENLGFYRWKNDSSSKRLEEAARVPSSVCFKRSLLRLFLTKISEIYPSLCSDDVYPLILDDDFHIDIDSANDLRIARMVLTGSAG